MEQEGVVAARGSNTKGKDATGTGSAGVPAARPKQKQSQAAMGQNWSRPEIGIAALQAFTYGQRPVRAVEKDGKAWFVAQDVCDVLGIANSREAFRKLDESEKGVSKGDTPGGDQKMQIVSESGALYIIMRSNRPEAKAFRLWVTGVVLPGILRTGSYSVSSPGESNSPQVTLPGPGRYIAEMGDDGRVTCLMASHEEAATRIFLAEGRILVHTLKLIQAHWSIVQQSQVFDDDPKPIHGSAELHQAITEGVRLAERFLPCWDNTTRRQS